MEEIETPRFYKVKDVAEFFDISKNAITNKCQAGRIRAAKVGGSWRIYADQFPEMAAK